MYVEKRELRVSLDRSQGPVAMDILNSSRRKKETFRLANISRSGMFLELENGEDVDLKLGTSIHFRLNLDDEVKGVATVRWLRPQSQGPYLKRGIGLQVLEFHENAERTYLKFLEDALINLRVTDLMQPKFACVTSLASIGEALEKLADEGTDVVIVTDASGKSMGLLDKSHAVKIALNGIDLSGSVAKVMNDQPVSITTNSGTDDVYAVMRYGTTEHLPVEEDGIVVGLISVRDLIPFWSEYMDLQARRLSKNYEQVLSVMAHDLRTPIGVVKSTNQFITGGYDMSLEEYVDSGLPDIIESSCNTMLKLIDGILDLGQIRNGNIALSRELIDLEDLIDRVARCFGPLAASKKIEIEIDIPTAVPKVKADSLRIEQVINNLVSNALKFSKEKSKVVIGMKAHHSKVAFWVADNGQGIPESEQENLFSEYGTTSIKPTAGESSTGLGLAICKRIVEAHNGSIRVDSKLNEGSTFTVLLPIEEIQ